jgi:hypothetical protein
MKKVFSKANVPYWLGAIIVLFVICFGLLYVAEAQIPTIFTSNGIVAIISAIIGVLLTVFVTSILLKQQSETEQEKDKSLIVFEKRQEIYHAFLENLKSIIQGGEIKIGVKQKDGTIDRSVDGLKDLVFQLCYLQMHTSKETIDKVLNELAKIIRELKKYYSTEEKDKQKKMPEFYSSLSDALFKIVSTLKEDLYGKKDGSIERDKINKILDGCDLYVETNLDKYGLQKCFLEELREKLVSKGYKIDTKHDFTTDIKQYYARARNRHRYYGLNFEIDAFKENKPVKFKVEIGNEYCFGLYRLNRKEERKEITACLERMKNFKSEDWWFDRKYPSPDYRLDFLKLDSKGFDELKNPRKRENFITEIAEEIDTYIKEFQKKAREIESNV